MMTLFAIVFEYVPMVYSFTEDHQDNIDHIQPTNCDGNLVLQKKKTKTYQQGSVNIIKRRFSQIFSLL